MEKNVCPSVSLLVRYAFRPCMSERYQNFQNPLIDPLESYEEIGTTKGEGQNRDRSPSASVIGAAS